MSPDNKTLRTGRIIVHVDRLGGFIDELLAGCGSVIDIDPFDENNREVWYRANIKLASRVIFGEGKRWNIGQPDIPLDLSPQNDYIVWPRADGSSRATYSNLFKSDSSNFSIQMSNLFDLIQSGYVRIDHIEKVDTNK